MLQYTEKSILTEAGAERALQAVPLEMCVSVSNQGRVCLVVQTHVAPAQKRLVEGLCKKASLVTKTISKSVINYRKSSLSLSISSWLCEQADQCGCFKTHSRQDDTDLYDSSFTLLLLTFDLRTSQIEGLILWQLTAQGHRGDRHAHKQHSQLQL